MGRYGDVFSTWHRARTCKWVNKYESTWFCDSSPEQSGTHLLISTQQVSISGRNFAWRYWCVVNEKRETKRLRESMWEIQTKQTQFRLVCFYVILPFSSNVYGNYSRRPPEINQWQRSHVNSPRHLKACSLESVIRKVWKVYQFVFLSLQWYETRFNLDWCIIQEQQLTCAIQILYVFMWSFLFKQTFCSQSSCTCCFALQMSCTHGSEMPSGH